MSRDGADARYQQIIDRLVHSCQQGQGQIGAQRCRAGVWNRNAVPGAMDPATLDVEDEWRRPATEAAYREQRSINLLLARLSSADREVLASMLAQEFVSGVHETLVVLHEMSVAPLDRGYEGDPVHDFIGRLGGDWPWPPAGTSRT